MKVVDLYTTAKDLLCSHSIESPEFEATCLLEDIGRIGRGKMPCLMDNSISDELAEAVLQAVKRRISGEPLQYILGNWDFLNLTLKVGDGVLIPRPETELLCQIVADELKKKNKITPVVIWDLCAGSGCVGLGIASLYANCSTTCVELSKEALTYLNANLQAYPQLPVSACQADVLSDYNRSPFNDRVDVIVSNPPYIPTKELNGLQHEVQREPRMALDGDTDGYRFYRAIAQYWIPKLNNDGLVAVEVGIGQADTVAKLFEQAGLGDIGIFKDFAGIERVVCASKTS